MTPCIADIHSRVTKLVNLLDSVTESRPRWHAYRSRVGVEQLLEDGLGASREPGRASEIGPVNLEQREGRDESGARRLKQAGLPTYLCSANIEH
jgi:hypothetical protein